MSKGTEESAVQRPIGCKLSAALNKRSHNHYIQICVKLKRITVSIHNVRYNENPESPTFNGFSQLSPSSPTDQQAEERQCASFLKEVLVDMNIRTHMSNWEVTRHFNQLMEFDESLHRCCIQRSGSGLFILRDQAMNYLKKSRGQPIKTILRFMQSILVRYFIAFGIKSERIASGLTCPQVLDVLDLNCEGQQLSDTDRYNTQSIAVGRVTKPFRSAYPDELSLTVGDMVALTYVTVNMDEPVWWEGKIIDIPSSESGGHPYLGPRKSLKRIGVFPSTCVRIIEKEGRTSVSTDSIDSSPIRRNYGTILTVLKAFFRSRPAENDLRRTGILKNRLFGSDLTSYINDNDNDVPPILDFCTSIIEKHGCNLEGIYRKSGNGADIQQLRFVFDSGALPQDSCSCNIRASMNVKREEVDFSTDPSPMCVFNKSIHNYTNVLKTYFRELAMPLLADQSFLKCKPVRADVEVCISKLPPAHLRVARKLFQHLKAMSAFQSATLMTSTNLAIVWSPNLLPPIDTSDIKQIASLTMNTAHLVSFLIDNADDLFQETHFNSEEKFYDMVLPPSGEPQSINRHSPFAGSIKRNSRRSSNFHSSENLADVMSLPHVATAGDLQTFQEVRPGLQRQRSLETGLGLGSDTTENHVDVVRETCKQFYAFNPPSVTLLPRVKRGETRKNSTRVYNTGSSGPSIVMKPRKSGPSIQEDQVRLASSRSSNRSEN